MCILSEHICVSLLPIVSLIVCLRSAESMRPVKNCFLAVLSSHGDQGCIFGADGKAVKLSRIFSYFDNECMKKKAKVFLIQVGVFPDSHIHTQTDHGDEDGGWGD